MNDKNRNDVGIGREALRTWRERLLKLLERFLDGEHRVQPRKWLAFTVSESQGRNPAPRFRRSRRRFVRNRTQTQIEKFGAEKGASKST